MNSMSEFILRFLDHACHKLGFCFSKDERTEIAQNIPYDCNWIATVILETEGLDAQLEVELFRQIKDLYTEFQDRNLDYDGEENHLGL